MTIILGISRLISDLFSHSKHGTHDRLDKVSILMRRFYLIWLPVINRFCPMERNSFECTECAVIADDLAITEVKFPVFRSINS